jgi:histone-lysine N-methyltransferase SETD3
VTSRAFRVRGPDYPAALLPLIDMANHSFDPNCEVLPVATSTGAPKGSVAMFAKRSIAPGEPLLLNYGGLNSDFFFMDYGFVPANNHHDRVALRWDIELLEASGRMGFHHHHHHHHTSSKGQPVGYKSERAWVWVLV